MNDSDVLKTRALKISLVAILSVFVFEFLSGMLANSLALITDSIHALLDAAVTGILLIAARLALKPRDIDHTYGHGKIETIGGFIGGIALFVLASFFILEAFLRIINQHQTDSVNPGMMGFAAVLYTLAVDGFRIFILRRASRNSESTTLKADLYHAFTDLASTCVAFVGIWLVTTGFTHGDSLAAIALGGLLAYLSSNFAYRNALELTDTISPKMVAKVREATNNTEGVLECNDVKMRRVGRDVFVEATISLRANISFENAHSISARVEDSIIRNIGGRPHITIHFEPTWSSDLPVDAIIEKIALDVNGVKGVHNISVSKINRNDYDDDAIFVSLHIQVDRTTKFVDAHAIANSVETMLKKHMKDVKHTTVHLEPVMPAAGEIKIIKNEEIEQVIRDIASTRNYIKDIREIMVYRTNEGLLKIDISCIFSTDETYIEEVHKQVSEVEKEILTRFPNAIVTIHAEPE